MGREIRRVPPNWEHPKESVPNWQTGRMEERYKPLFHRTGEEAWADWCEEFAEWTGGKHKEIAKEYGEDDYPLDQPYTAFCKYHGSPPDPECYRPQWAEGEATWFQAYETVSEGTPVSPPFATEAELVDYLCEHGDFWDQERRRRGRVDFPCDPWSREAAEKFVRGAYVPSMVIKNGVVKTGPQILED